MTDYFTEVLEKSVHRYGCAVERPRRAACTITGGSEQDVIAGWIADDPTTGGILAG
jgi:hypothetical protein